MSPEPVALFGQIADGGQAAVDAVDIVLSEARHPFEAAHGAEIAENWSREQAANPRLYNGRMALLVDAALDGRRLVGECREVDFASFLLWRRQGEAHAHVFAFAALVGSDGALLAGRMAAHTANPGRVYFAAGSFERDDFPGGRIDVEANARREVLEETGLDLAGLARDDAHVLLRAGRAFGLARRYYLGEPAAAAAARVAAFLAGESEPEIEAPVVIRAGDRLDGLTPHMRRFVDWHFASL